MTAFYGYIVQTFTKETRQKLTISEDKYCGLFENANDGIIILRDPQLQIADVNREAETVTGYGKGELLGREIFVLFGPVEESKALGYFEEVRSKGEARTDSIALMRQDRIPMEVDLSTKKIDLGDESFYQVIFRDLTDQRKLSSLW